MGLAACLLEGMRHPRLPARLALSSPVRNQEAGWGAWSYTYTWQEQVIPLQCQRRPAKRGNLNKTLSYNTCENTQFSRKTHLQYQEKGKTHIELKKPVTNKQQFSHRRDVRII